MHRRGRCRSTQFEQIHTPWQKQLALGAFHDYKAATREHVQNNESVRDMLGQRGIKPEQLPPEEDIKKLERRVKAEEKKLVQQSGTLPAPKE